MTKSELISPNAILNALARAKTTLPRAALQQAVDHWPEVGPAFLRLLEAACVAQPSPRDSQILLFGIYLMAQVRETRAFRPLCIIASRGTLIDNLIGDGVTEDLSAIFVRVYDGDPAPLRSLIEAEDADEFVRDAALDAVAWLTATGRIDRDDTARYLADLCSTLRPLGASYVWVGWQQAVARLGLENLVPLVEKVFERGWIDPTVLSVRHFRQDLLAAQQAAEPAAVFDPADVDSRLSDIMAAFANWGSFRPGPRPAPKSLAQVSGLAGSAPVRNPSRSVGRNDPCPCGSGKKFKNCCLAKAQ